MPIGDETGDAEQEVHEERRDDDEGEEALREDIGLWGGGSIPAASPKFNPAMSIQAGTVTTAARAASRPIVGVLTAKDEYSPRSPRMAATYPVGPNTSTGGGMEVNASTPLPAACPTKSTPAARTSVGLQCSSKSENVVLLPTIIRIVRRLVKLPGTAQMCLQHICARVNRGGIRSIDTGRRKLPHLNFVHGLSYALFVLQTFYQISAKNALTSESLAVISVRHACSECLISIRSKRNSDRLLHLPSLNLMTANPI